MKILKQEDFTIVYGVLTRGVDYEESQLVTDECTINKQRKLEGGILRAIAKKNGFDLWLNATCELDSKINVKFQKRKECKMMQLGNLAIVAANHKDCMLQIYDNEVTVHTGQGTERKSISCNVNDNDYINKIIAYLNFGTEIVK